MIPYTGDYIEHIDGSIDNFKYFTFTPRPLMHGDMYKMDDELSTFLIEAHRNIGILKGLFKYIQLLPKSVWRVYDYLKLFPVTGISHAVTQVGSSFNSISNALHLLRENGIVTQENNNMRNRIWKYTALASHLIQD